MLNIFHYLLDVNPIAAAHIAKSHRDPGAWIEPPSTEPSA